MNQKYLISKSDDNNELMIKEFAELDRGVFSLTCEEKYDAEAVSSAIEKGTNALISALRTQAFYPVRFSMEKIAEAVVNLYGSESHESLEILFNDMDLFTKEEVYEEEVVESLEEDESESVEIDELLEDNLEDEDYVGDDEIKNIGSSSVDSFKVTSDDSLDVEDV